MANGMKGTTAKIIGTAMALLIIIVGIWGGSSFDVAKAIIFITAGLVIGAEYSLSSFIDKANRAVDVITAVFIITLIGVGLLSLTKIAVPAFIGAASTYILVLAGLWVLFETYFN